MSRLPVVRTGADVASSEGWSTLRGSRLGVFSNPSGVLPDLRHVVDDMARTDGLDIRALFGPEHGFRGSAQAGFSEADTTDERLGVPVYDAYGIGADRMAELFRRSDLETVVWDVQEVGARFYTRLWIMYRAMWAAADLGLRFVVLDRPNPLGGRPDGPALQAAFVSDVGLKPIVQQHGMTVGELAGLFAGEYLGDDTSARLDLEVVPLRGWLPDSRPDQHGLPWVPPSPNIPTADSALSFVGTGLVEGTNLSEGRGTPKPFEFIGAPFLDYRWVERLNARDLPGVRFRETYFRPTFSKHQGELCAGAQIHVTDPLAYQPIRTAVAILAEARRYDGFAWRRNDTAFSVDRLFGSARLRSRLDAGADVDDVADGWNGEVRAFAQVRQPYLRYQRPSG